MMLLQSESLARGWARRRRDTDLDWPATVTGRPQAYMILILRVSRPGHAEMWLPSRPLSGWAVKLTRSLGPATVRHTAIHRGQSEAPRRRRNSKPGVTVRSLAH